MASEAWKTLRWLAAIGAFLLALWLGLGFFERSVRGTTSAVQQGLDQILAALTHSNTRIVEGRAEVVTREEIAELALIELRMSATRTFENEGYLLRYVPAGKKQLIVRGDYRVTAGYRLQPGVSLRVEDGLPVASFPEPEILGVELIDFEILNERDGWANNINAEDRATLLRDLRQQMGTEAERSGVLDLVESSLRTRLGDLFGAPEVRIERPAEE